MNQKKKKSVNYYDVLGVTKKSSQDDIKSAYKKLALVNLSVILEMAP
jgi:curved DNA-binding protein CbpA